MPLRPILAGIDQATAEEQFSEAVPRAHEIVTGIIARPTEITHGFLCVRRGPDNREEVCP
jgi:hypothetical protein